MSTVTSAPAERVSLLTRPFLIVTATALLFFVYIGMLIPIVPLFVEGPLAAGEFGIGLTVAAFAPLAAICARPLIGRFADRYGRRVLMVGGRGDGRSERNRPRVRSRSSGSCSHCEG